MSATPDRPYHEAVLVPALLEIQKEHGYLEREALVECSKRLGLPLARLHAVASFFPHFRLTAPPKVTLRICRDMACHMAGSAQMLEELAQLAGKEVAVEGVSCLGRCDRAPAACVAVRGVEHDELFLGRTSEELAAIVKACGDDGPTAPNHDRDPIDPMHGTRFSCFCEPLNGGAESDRARSVIDLYKGEPQPAYSALSKATELRDRSLLAGMECLKWTRERHEQFRLAAIRHSLAGMEIEPDVQKAVTDWLTANDWAAGKLSPEAEKALAKSKGLKPDENWLTAEICAEKGNLGGWSEGILMEMEKAKLGGMGGGGASAAGKWRDVRDAVRDARSRGKDARAFIIANGDESEPATFKDRELLLHAPWLVIEGVILAGLVTEATEGFIYIRHEYTEQIAACKKEIKRAESMGFCGRNASLLGRPFPVSVFTSPGGYICGEQSALVEAMSDNRGEPRNMPPTLETNGLLNLPTVVGNVETFAWTPSIYQRGGAAYAAAGVNEKKGRRLFSVTGDVCRPGVYEVPIGLPLRELIEGQDYCRGVAGGRALKAFAPSGPSGGFLPARLRTKKRRKKDDAKAEAKADAKEDPWDALARRRGFDANAPDYDILDLELELDIFRKFSPTQALGAGLVVYNDTRNMVAEAVNAVEFFRNESCGKCVPCRLGAQKMVAIGRHLLSGQMSEDAWHKQWQPLLEDMGTVIKLASICGLGRSVPSPLKTVADYFPQDVAAYLAAAPTPSASEEATA